MNCFEMAASFCGGARRLVGRGFSAVVLLAWTTGCSLPGDGINQTSGSCPPEFIIQSHRGAGKLAPENTMQAFELAWRLGTVPEADVRTTKDGVVVAFHDATLDRLVSDLPPEFQGKGTRDLTWSELSKLRIGPQGQPIPRILEVLDAIRGRPERWLYLDVKEVPLERLAEMVSERGVASQVILASTKYEETRRWKELLPRSQTLLWMGGSEAGLSRRLKEVKAADFIGVTQLQIHVKVGNLASEDTFQPSAAFLRAIGEELKARRILFQVFCPGGCDAAGYERLLQLGVQSLATDDPEAALEAVRNHKKRSKK
ncbi:MAG TPA: glycerophosphodiester phosphodiesterase family protein [Phycisphaerae bacterium]|nr:glycerophosphodiester phosphodiesterase family protein [Phycisphaerae bacterium]HRR84715.1 glycerophosphodiester phosphodiesterase family protein [Phycisphaerae bacterium]